MAGVVMGETGVYLHPGGLVMKKLINWLSDFAVSLLHWLIEKVIERIIRWILPPSLLALVIVALYPAHDDWCIETTPRCDKRMAQMCLIKWSNCQGIGIAVDPTNPGRVTRDPTRMLSCAKDYTAECSDCGSPKDNGSYFERMQRYGPWWLGEGETPYCPARS